MVLQEDVSIIKISEYVGWQLTSCVHSQVMCIKSLYCIEYFGVIHAKAAVFLYIHLGAYVQHGTVCVL